MNPRGDPGAYAYVNGVLPSASQLHFTDAANVTHGLMSHLQVNLLATVRTQVSGI